MDVVEEVLADALEILRTKGGSEQAGTQELVICVQIFFGGDGGEGGHLFIHPDIEGARHGKEGVFDLAVGKILGAAFGEHVSGERGEAGLIHRVGGGAGGEDDAEGDERRFGGKLDHAHLRQCGGGGEQDEGELSHFTTSAAAVCGVDGPSVTVVRLFSVRYFLAAC